MKPYADLTRRGRILRMRSLARDVLQAYGIPEAHFSFLREAGNTLFLVKEASIPSLPGDRYIPGQFLLRIHQPDYQTRAGIELEMEWLSSMAEAGLPVPAPLRNRDGRLLTSLAVPGVPEERNISLLRWIRGLPPRKPYGQHHYRAQGELMASLHNFSAAWQPPAGATKRRYDAHGLFEDASQFGMPAGEAWSLLPEGCNAPYREIARRLEKVMHSLGCGTDVFGLIHADLGPDANLLFHRGAARAIDFDDSGFGYYLYDLGIALEHIQDDPVLPASRAALLEGYNRLRSLPQEHLPHIELFLQGFNVFISLWCAAGTHIFPRHRDELLARLQRAFGFVKAYLGRNP